MGKKVKQVWKNILHYFIGIICALIVALFLRLFIVDFFIVPSDSMLPAIEPGDFILVDKISFGARMYRNFDFLKKGTEPETWRVKGFSGIHHGDVVVFNFPYTKGWNKIRMHLSRFYVKRCIGLPGDTLAIRDGYYEINGQRGFGNMAAQRMLAGYPGSLPSGIYRTFPFNRHWNWNIFQMGPIYLPARGKQITLDSVRVCLYGKLIEYETRGCCQVKKGKVYCADTLVSAYCFRSNWYFMGGDHLLNSQDSRYIGLIPEEFIIGKARLVLIARDPQTRDYRWERFFTRIK